MADASPSSPEQQILARMQVPGARGLYVLGCFERRVTLYSQQVRALNLVYALRDQLLATKPAVAVIGAGASGITAAVAAAACGCRVAVFERLGSPLGFIGPARTRWLHPHIYDWPANGAEDPDAGLPILTWREGMADRVGEELQTQWHERADQFQIDLHCNVSDLSIDEDAVADADGRPQHLLTCNGTGPEPRHRGRHDDPGPGGRSGHHMLMGRFDIVILAVGFGVEAPSEKFPQVNSYWENDRIDEEDRHSKRPERHVLISGTGDGGLIDLLRYSFSRFRHDEILKRLRDHLAAQGELERVLQTIQQIEADAVAHSQAGRPYIAPLNLAYRTLIDSLPSRAMLPVRRNIRATLTGRNKQPFDLESAALNRFLACFTDYEWIPLGTTAVHRTGDHGPYAVTLANGETRSFDELPEHRRPLRRLSDVGACHGGNRSGAPAGVRPVLRRSAARPPR
jgi:hypothetical protein